MFPKGDTSVLVVDSFFIPFNMKDIPKVMPMEGYVFH